MVKFENLNKPELQQLRNEIVLNSLYVADYRNSFGFNAEDVCSFFDGYYTYLEELCSEDHEVVTHELTMEYDTIDNLVEWFYCFDDLSWMRYENDEEAA